MESFFWFSIKWVIYLVRGPYTLTENQEGNWYIQSEVSFEELKSEKSKLVPLVGIQPADSLFDA